MRKLLRQLRSDLILKLHGSGTRVQTSATKEMVDNPIPAEWITDGTPRARAFCAVSSADGRILSGEWDCTAGSFRWTYYEDETIRILEGEAHIEVDGVFRVFGPGDALFFPLGQSVRWVVPQYVRKVFFIRHPNRLVSFMRSFKLLGSVALWLTAGTSELDPRSLLGSSQSVLDAVARGAS